MKKLFITMLILAGTFNANCQERINYYPFCYEGKWGIADDNKNEVAAPEAKDIDFLEKEKDFVFMKEANGTNYFFNITDGSKLQTRGALGSRLDIGKESYYLMTAESGDYLYSFATKKEYPQQLKYKFMYTKKLTDEKGKVYTYVIGYLTNGKIVVMDGNSTQLKQALQGTFEEVTYVGLGNDDYGIVLKKGDQCLAYNPSLALKGSFTSDKQYLFLDDSAEEKLVKLYGRKVYLSDVPQLMRITRESENLDVTTTYGGSFILSRKGDGTGTRLAVIKRGPNEEFNFEDYKGLELFRVVKDWEPVFAGVIKVIDGKKEIMVPAKYTGIQ